MALPQPKAHVRRSRPLLVVAADPVERDGLRAALEAKGWTVDTAADARTTAEAIRARPPGLVILRHAPGHDSWSVAVEAACLPGVPILFLADDDRRSAASSRLGDPAQPIGPRELDRLDEQVRDLVAAQPDSGMLRLWRHNFLPAGDDSGPASGRNPIAGGAGDSFPPTWSGLVRNRARARHQQDIARWLLSVSRTNRLELEHRRAVLAETRAWSRGQARHGFLYLGVLGPG